jgi:hypothetical protein
MSLRMNGAMVLSRPVRAVLWVALAAFAASAIAWTSARRTPRPLPRVPTERSSTHVLHVPRVAGPIPITAEVEGKKDWEGERGNTPNFVDATGMGMVPYTEARVRWGDGKLYLLLYAGDLDLEGTVEDRDGPLEQDDSFRLEFPSGREVRVVVVSILGVLADRICTGTTPDARCDSSWDSRAVVAVDRDGTMNKIGDNDEEWVVEMAIPLASLGLPTAGPGTRIPFTVSRCEVGHGPHACGAWGAGTPPGQLELDP